MRRNGFTLMEVLVAMVILGVMAIGYLTLAGRQAEHSHYLLDKTIAAIVASNVIAESQVARAWPNAGPFTKEVTMAGRKWKISGNVKTTASPGLLRMEVGVAPEESAPIVTLTGFLGKN